MKFKKLLEETVKEHYDKKYKDNNYVSLVKYLKPLHRYNIDKLSTRYVKALIDLLQSDESPSNKPLSNSTVNCILSIISQCYEYAYLNLDYEGKQPHLKCLWRDKHQKVKPIIPFTDEHYQAYVDYAKENDEILYHYLIIGKYMLFRVSEMVGIEECDVNWNTRYIEIPENKSSRPHSMPMNDDTEKSMRALQHRNYFSDFSTFQIFYKFMLAEEALKLGHYTPHSTRHYGATTYLVEGVPLPVVQAMLNHANATTTQIYSHVNNSHIERYVRGVAA